MQKESAFHVSTVKTLEDRISFNKAWHDTWLEEGYASYSYNIIEKYSKFDLFSLDYLVLNVRNEATGTMRIINQNDSVGLPALNDFAIHCAFDAGEKLCEATLLTVKKSERGQDHLPTFILLAELWRYVRANRVSGIVIAADIRLWFLLKQKFGLCFNEIGQRKMYEGSLTVPGYLNVSEQKEHALKKSPKNLLEVVFHEV